MNGDHGQAGLWSVWAAALVLAATTAVLTWGAAVETRQRAETVADMAALAAASAQVRGQDPCAPAHRVAQAQRGRLVTCAPAVGAVAVVVEVPASSTLLRRLDMPPARARARAGVPP